MQARKNPARKRGEKHMKKTFAIIPTLALAFAFSTSLALASDSCCENNRHDRDSKCCPSVEISNKSEAKVLNNISSSSNSGLNKIFSGFEKKTSSKYHHDSAPVANAKIVTGDAKAWAYSDTYANDTKIVVTAPKAGKVKVTNDSEACVTNNVTSSANSGQNFISKTGTIKTGYTGSWSEVMTMVNTNIIKVK